MKMRSIACSVVAIATATPAFAQQDAQNRSYGRPIDSVENMVDMALGRFAFCAESSSRGMVDKVLSTPIASDAETAAVHKLVIARRDCLPSDRSPFTPTAVRNALATVIYRREYRDVVPAATPSGTPSPRFSVAPAGVQGTESQLASWYMAAVANCVVFVDAPGVHRLVTGPINVPEEDKRFADLVPDIGRCSAPDGPKLGIRVMRGFFGDALLTRVSAHDKTKG